MSVKIAAHICGLSRLGAIMLHDFLNNNRDELARRCRVKVSARPGRLASERQLATGIPLFLDQLIRTLRVEQSQQPYDSRKISGPAGGAAALSEVSVSAAQHGKDLLGLGLTVDQVVHDYGDLCQAITDLAVERDAPFEVDEFRTLNRCLDNAISDAVTEFSYQRDAINAQESQIKENERLGMFAYELRTLLGTASLAFSAAKAGNLSLTGATGSILERSLTALERLITQSVDEGLNVAPFGMAPDAFSLAIFIQELHSLAAVTAKVHGCRLSAPPVDAELAIAGARDLLLSAVANFLQNAFKFTRPGTEVILSAYAAGESIIIDVQDNCGGLGEGVAQGMFEPFTRYDEDRSGIGLGLTIAKQSVRASGGNLTVRDIAGHGCVFSVVMPRHQMIN